MLTEIIFITIVAAIAVTRYIARRIKRNRKRARQLILRRKAYGNLAVEASEALTLLTQLHLPEVTSTSRAEVFGRFFDSINAVGMLGDQKIVGKAFAYASIFNIHLRNILLRKEQGAESDELARLCYAASM